jgi:hypothetical protein
MPRSNRIGSIQLSVAAERRQASTRASLATQITNDEIEIILVEE